MVRRGRHVPLDVLINDRLVGRLVKESNGAISFGYDQGWLDWEHRFAVSLSLPLQKANHRGGVVAAVFDNLLPDNVHVRRHVAERVGAEGTDAWSLLAAIGRDCVGAMQFLPEGGAPEPSKEIEGEPISDSEIEAMLANLKRAPLGLDREHEFRISVAGAQEKTALLRHEGQWLRPIGTTPTSHILKPQIGAVPTATGILDLANSVENEHYCLTLLGELGLPVSPTEIATFGDRKVLVVERFDRQWRGAARLLRLPQEDCCQALGIPPTQKYQSSNGPSAADILRLLEGGDDPLADQAAFLKSQILFWLIGATDGHGKNFSIFLRPGGRYALTPFYDVLTAQPAFDARQIPHNKYKLAMSAGWSRKYAILKLTGRHFVETAKEAGLGPTLIRAVLTGLLAEAAAAAERALAKMPKGFAMDIHQSVVAAMATRLRMLEMGLNAI